MPQKRLKISDIGNKQIIAAWGNSRNLARAGIREYTRYNPIVGTQSEIRNLITISIALGIVAANAHRYDYGGLEFFNEQLINILNDEEIDV